MGRAVHLRRLLVCSALATTGVSACSSDGGSESTSVAPTTRSSTASTTEVATTEVATSATRSPATTTSAPTTSYVPPVPAGWVADEVSVDTVLGTVWGTLTHPADSAAHVPAELIIGGSGPTDRDGNTVLIPGVIDSLLTVANWLAADGVATLRTDKPGSGRTGLGNRTPAAAASVTVDDFLTMNAQLLAFLSTRPGIESEHIGVVGHSEGGLFAVLLASGQHGAATGVPTVRAIAALEPQSLPILDHIVEQVTAQVQQAQAAGQISSDRGNALLLGLAAAVSAVRSGSPLPTDLPQELAGLFPATALTYLRTEDAVDPRTVAAQLPNGMPVLISCSDADIQVSCADVEQLSAAATTSGADVTLVHLTDVAHTLKVDPSRSADDYGADLPFSPELQQALATWSSK